MIPVFEPRDAEELTAHYARLKAKLYTKPPVVMNRGGRFVEPEPDPTPKEPLDRDLGYQCDFHVATFRTCRQVETPVAWAKADRSRVIMRMAADRHGVDVDEMIGNGRQSLLVLARQEACYNLREELQWSWAKIGKVMGGRDHTTVYSNYKRHKLRIESGNLFNVPTDPKRVVFKFCPDLEEAVRVVKMHKAGMSNRAIAQHCLFDAAKIRAILDLYKGVRDR